MYGVREFSSDSDGETQLNIRISADGYRRVEAPGIWVKKGESTKIALRRDDGKPYPVSWTFWGHDMITSKYVVVTSPVNDTTQPIELKISSPADYHLKVYFTDKEGKKPVTVGEKDGKKGDQSFTFQGQWLMKAPADGKLYDEITCNGQTETYQASLQLKASVLKKPLGDPNSKSALNPGFQFVLPDGWVKPFGGMKICPPTAMM